MKWLDDYRMRLVLLGFIAAFMVIGGGRANADFAFGTPILVPNVNSSSGEAYPNMSSDGLSLYFVSNRLGGYGGMDLWVATRKTTDDDWNTPVNLGPLVNSSSNDASPSISADELTLYFSDDGLSGFEYGASGLAPPSGIITSLSIGIISPHYCEFIGL